MHLLIIQINRTYTYISLNWLYNHLLSPSRVPFISFCIERRSTSSVDRIPWRGTAKQITLGRIQEKCQIVARGQPWPELTGSRLAGSLFLSPCRSSLPEDTPASADLLVERGTMNVTLSLRHETNSNNSNFFQKFLQYLRLYVICNLYVRGIILIFYLIRFSSSVKGDSSNCKFLRER